MFKLDITYSEEFRTKCFNNLRFYMDIRLLIAAMDFGRHTIVRYYLEDAVDDAELYEPKNGSEEERNVAIERIHAHTVRKELYSEFMTLLLNAEDEKDERIKARLLSKRRSI